MIRPKKKISLKVVINFILASIILFQIPACQKDDVVLDRNRGANSDTIIIPRDSAKNQAPKDTITKDSVIPTPLPPAPDPVPPTPDPVSKLAGTKIYVQNPGTNKDIQPYLLKAYNSAKDGDILVLPAGTFTFTGNLKFTKTVSLIGAGMDKTIIYRPESISDASIAFTYLLNYEIWRDTPSGIVISDFTLKGKTPSIVSGDGKSTARDVGIGIYGAVDFLVTRCKFQYFGEAGIAVGHRDYLARGVISDNHFYRNCKGPDGQGTGYGISLRGENKQWVKSANFGTSNFIFIEDNKFEYQRHSISSGTGALYVARYNTILNNLIGHAIDMHGPASTGAISARATEIYNNTIKNTDKMGSYAVGIRGGESLIYNNTAVGVKYFMALIPQYTAADASKPYPKPYQQGYNSAKIYGALDSGTDASHGDGDVFIWNNQASGSTLLNNVVPSLISLNRDYHLTQKPNYKPYIYPHPLRSKY